MDKRSRRSWAALGGSVVASLLVVVPGAGCAGRIDLGSIPDRDAGLNPDALSPSLADATNGNSEPAPTDGVFTSNGDASAPGPEIQSDATVGPNTQSDATSAPTMMDSPAPTLDPVAPGLAGFGFVVNDVVQHPMACPSDNWEFSASTTPSANCGFPPPCGADVTSVYLVNTGQFPVAYIAAAEWNYGAYVPGVATGDSYQLVGVLDPGARVDIMNVYDHGITTALLGSSAPFSAPDAGKYESDEGSIPWPAGVAGSQGSATMWLAEVEVRPSCSVAAKVW